MFGGNPKKFVDLSLEINLHCLRIIEIPLHHAIIAILRPFEGAADSS
jgi:hypothetical protein